MTDRTQESMVRAHEDLDAARSNHENGYERVALNRLYYACFHAARAVLYDRGYDPSKHRRVMSLVDRELVHKGRLPSEQSQTLRDLFNDRQSADYEFDEFEQTTPNVERLLVQAETFVDHMAELLEEH